MLSGIGVERILFPGTGGVRGHLEVLETTLLRLLELE
jgi:hypothetical protein